LRDPAELHLVLVGGINAAEGRLQVDLAVFFACRAIRWRLGCNPRLTPGDISARLPFIAEGERLPFEEFTFRIDQFPTRRGP
jgi:hypothetical protein